MPLWQAWLGSKPVSLWKGFNLNASIQVYIWYSTVLLLHQLLHKSVTAMKRKEQKHWFVPVLSVTKIEGSQSIDLSLCWFLYWAPSADVDTGCQHWKITPGRIVSRTQKSFSGCPFFLLECCIIPWWQWVSSPLPPLFVCVSMLGSLSFTSLCVDKLPGQPNVFAVFLSWC